MDYLMNSLFQAHFFSYHAIYKDLKIFNLPPANIPIPYSLSSVMSHKFWTVS